VKLLDTDVCVALLRGKTRVIARREAVADDIATTWVTAAELHYGAAKSDAPPKNHGLVDRFLGTVPVLGLDGVAAQIFGELKALLERHGSRLADADLLIAAIALANGATIVTGNRRHYGRIPGLVLEDWLRG
jgi:tRNA(fMet)-specific endonuclease VapC